LVTEKRRGPGRPPVPDWTRREREAYVLPNWLSDAVRRIAEREDRSRSAVAGDVLELWVRTNHPDLVPESARKKE
jgi:hypothetical protein